MDDPDQQLQQPDLPLDALDAVAAALAAWVYSTDWFHPVKDDGWLDEGAIILPQVAPA